MSIAGRPRKKNLSAQNDGQIMSIDSLTESTLNSRKTTPTVNYLEKARNSATVAPDRLEIGMAADRLKEIVPPEDLKLPSFDPEVLIERLRSNMPEDLRNNHQYINNLLEDTDPSHLLPPQAERDLPNGRKDDWQAIDRDSVLVSQRLLYSYHSKRRLLRNERSKLKKVDKEETVLKSEHIGYRRYNAHGLQLEKQFYQENMYKMGQGNLTDENRPNFIDPASMVITIGIFPPRQKGIITRQSTEIKVLDSTYLTDLFDHIHCPTDYISLRSGQEFASNPDINPSPTVGEQFPNRFIFVESEFFYDDRKHNSDIVAAQVAHWVETHDISIDRENLNLIPIHQSNTQIRDLKPVFGFPYLYQHANDCEHLLVFMDIRVLSPDDPQDREYYPLLTAKPNPRRNICKSCNIHSAKWETREDELADEDPCFWCDQCFREFHYDSRKMPTHKFLAKPFVDPAIIMDNPSSSHQPNKNIDHQENNYENMQLESVQEDYSMGTDNYDHNYGRNIMSGRSEGNEVLSIEQSAGQSADHDGMDPSFLGDDNQELFTKHEQIETEEIQSESNQPISDLRIPDESPSDTGLSVAKAET